MTLPTDSTDPNTTGEGFTQIILPTQMLVEIGRRLRDGRDDLAHTDLTQDEKVELLSAILRAIV